MVRGASAKDIACFCFDPPKSFVRGSHAISVAINAPSNFRHLLSFGYQLFQQVPRVEKRQPKILKMILIPAYNPPQSFADLVFALLKTRVRYSIV